MSFIPTNTHDTAGGLRVLAGQPLDAKYWVADADSRLAFDSNDVYQGLLVYQLDTSEWWRLDGTDHANATSWTFIPVDSAGGVDYPGTFADLLADTTTDKIKTTIFAVDGERDTSQQTPIGTADHTNADIDSAFLFNDRIGISLPTGVAVGTVFSLLIYSEGDPHTTDNLIYSLIGEEVGSTSASTASLNNEPGFGGSGDNSLRIEVTEDERDAIRTGSTTVSSSTYAISDGQIEFYSLSEIPFVPELYVFKSEDTTGATTAADWEHLTPDPDVIGVDVQAYSVSLDQISGLNSSAGRVIFGSSSGWTSVALNTQTSGSVVDQNDAANPKEQWFGTQTEYDAITSYDDNIEYKIIGATPTTDDIPEGSTNEYFTPARARQTFSQPTDSSTVTVPPGGQIIVATGRSFYNISEVNQSVSSTTSFVAPDAAVWDRVSSIEFDFQVVSALPGTLTNNTFYFVT